MVGNGSDVVNVKRVEIGMRNISVVVKSEEDDGELVAEKPKPGNVNKAKSVCADRRQRITQLDRYELEKAVMNASDYEHNIRRLLNYR